jgi:RsiW-degrading membrane proteinase PrsW (M82 family)
LKEWLGERIKHLSKWLTGSYNKLYIVLIPLIYALMVLSIHVYYENAPYLEVLKNEESIIGLIIGALIGLFVSFFAVTKIRKYELKNLEFLKDLYGRL